MSKPSQAERIEQALRAAADRYSIPDTPEAGVLAFLSKKVYGVRRWSNGEHDAKLFIIKAVLLDKYPEPTREQFVKITGEGDLYDLIVSPPDDIVDTKHRIKVMEEMKNPTIQPVCQACDVPMDRNYDGSKIIGYFCVICGALKEGSKDN